MAVKTFRIDTKELKNRYVQAPLAGFSDIAMRIQAARYGAGLVYTEMISATALARGSIETLNMVRDTQRDEAPVALQLFGSDEDDLRKAIGICEENGKYDFLDFNLGCPVPKVMKQDAGSHLLKDLDKAYRLVKAMVEASHKPVIVKSRLGFKDPEDCVKIVEALQDAGAKAIAMHGRTRDEFYLGLPHYDLLKKAREHCKVTFIANGNLGESNALKMLDYIGADAVMFGRKAIGNPFIFSNMIALEEGKETKEPTLEERVAASREFLGLEYSRGRNPVILSKELRASMPAFFAGITNARKIRSLLVKCDSQEQYLELLEKIENHRIDGGEENEDTEI